MSKRSGSKTARQQRHMKFDVVGRVRNTSVPLQHAFLPLFEAVVNSIHATEDKFGDKAARQGKVTVKITRVPQESLPGVPGPKPLEPIKEVEIIDNGCGFTDENLEAFETADTTAKAQRGGKGVGRFTWLVVFKRADISSSFEASAGERMHRKFSFVPAGAGIRDFEEGAAKRDGESVTSVKLSGVHARYEEALRKGPEVIADKLFEHCFNYFVLGRCPEISLSDDASDEAVVVNNKQLEVEVAQPVSMKVGAHELKVRHVQRPAAADRHHEAHLCANQRVVTSFPLSRVSDLGADPIRSQDGRAHVHNVFVSGAALDEAVDTSRTRLDLPDGAPLLEHAGVLDLRTLRQAVGDEVNRQLRDVLEAERHENLARVQKYIRTEQPEYSPLLRHKQDALSRVRWTNERTAMDENLYRVQQAWDREVRQRQVDVEEKLVVEKTELDEIADELHSVVMETNEVGQSDLIRYVVKRRAVLQLLSKLISRFEGQALEEQIHKAVFPMRRTGDDAALTDHNLWLVDDTLAFYEYLTSDLSFTKNAAAPVESDRRPDILAFKTGDPYQHIAIVEFKRPDRDDENPVQQLVEYAQLMREGGQVDIGGRTLPGIAQSVRIDGYAVVTLNPKMEKKLEISPGDLRKVESEWRWYGYLTNLNLNIEVLDFRAFLRRAEQRNRAFFVKLGLP